MASSQDGNLGLWSGYTPGDNGWTVQHNQNWDMLDAFVQATVLSVTTTAPPASPANGAAYIVPSGATGAWASNTNKVAVWTSRGTGQWTIYTPKAGWMVYNQGDGGEYLYNGSSWVLYYSQKLAVPQDYISGLKMVWNSATSISVTSGSAYISSLGRLSLVNATLTLSSLSLTASTFYHVYLYENSGTPTIECVTTAPAAAYYGTARAKTGDTSRRYIGSVLTDASGNIFGFAHVGNEINYITKIVGGASPFRILLTGQATSTTSYSASGCVPPVSTLAKVRLQNSDASVTCFVADGDYAMSAGVDGQVSVAGNQTVFLNLASGATQNFKYQFQSTPTGGLNHDVIGYVYER